MADITTPKNNTFIHLSGPFNQGSLGTGTGDTGDIFANLIKPQNGDLQHARKVGIQAPPGHRVQMRDGADGTSVRTFVIGGTGILELNNVRVSALAFLQPEADTTLLDFIF